jgi:HAD superfamily hydrolase (TIGR01484 family)
MADARPVPLACLPDTALRDVRGVLTDIDDTLTTAGAITADALGALQRLRDAQVPVVAITGRPLGWSEPFARGWPVDAIVAENGAVALLRDGDSLRIEYVQDAAIRQRNVERLRVAANRILQDVPGARLARDSAGRVTDIAIDHAEFAQLAPAQIARVVALMRKLGMNASVSSIHINGWYGDHGKLSGARWIVKLLYGVDLDAAADRWVYVGDSTNDQQMFGHFRLSVGVANLRQFAQDLSVWPAYLTVGERGAGFAEGADRITEARR